MRRHFNHDFDVCQIHVITRRYTHVTHRRKIIHYIRKWYPFETMWQSNFEQYTRFHVFVDGWCADFGSTFPYSNGDHPQSGLYKLTKHAPCLRKHLPYQVSVTDALVQTTGIDINSHRTPSVHMRDRYWCESGLSTVRNIRLITDGPLRLIITLPGRNDGK